MNKADEYCLIVYGDYKNVEEAKNALQTPFIEDYVEEHGRFRLHDLGHIRVAKGVKLGDLEIAEVGEETFEISCRSLPIVMSKNRIEELAELLQFYDMFDEIEIEPIN